MNYIKCPDCQATKSESDFPFNRARPNGRGVYCRVCHALRTQAWKASNPDKRLKIQKEYNELRKARRKR